MALPPLDDLLQDLKELAEVEQIDPDVPVKDLGVESIDLLEWVFVMRDERGIEVDESNLEGLDENSTIREFYDRVLATAAAS